MRFSRLIKTSFFLAFSVLATAANATTYSFNLTGNATPISNFNGLAFAEIQLTNSSTGLNMLPGFNLNAGDVINGTITLSSALTVPATATESEILLYLSRMADGSITHFNQSFTLYYQGSQVTPSGQWTSPYGAGPGDLVFGIQSVATFSSIPSITFDSIVFSATFTEPADLVTFNPSLTAGVFYPLPAPLPASAWLMLSSLAGLAAYSKNRGR